MALQLSDTHDTGFFDSLNIDRALIQLHHLVSKVLSYTLVATGVWGLYSQVQQVLSDHQEIQQVLIPGQAVTTSMYDSVVTSAVLGTTLGLLSAYLGVSMLVSKDKSIRITRALIAVMIIVLNWYVQYGIPSWLEPTSLYQTYLQFVQSMFTVPR